MPVAAKLRRRVHFCSSDFILQADQVLDLPRRPLWQRKERTHGSARGSREARRIRRIIDGYAMMKTTRSGMKRIWAQGNFGHRHRYQLRRSRYRQVHLCVQIFFSKKASAASSAINIHSNIIDIPNYYDSVIRCHRCCLASARRNAAPLTVELRLHLQSPCPCTYIYTSTRTAIFDSPMLISRVMTNEHTIETNPALHCGYDLKVLHSRKTAIPHLAPRPVSQTPRSLVGLLNGLC